MNQYFSSSSPYHFGAVSPLPVREMIPTHLCSAKGRCSFPPLPLESTHMQMGRCRACGDVQSLLPFFALHSFPPFYLICGESSLKRTCDMRYVSTWPITKRASEDSEGEQRTLLWNRECWMD